MEMEKSKLPILVLPPSIMGHRKLQSKTKMFPADPGGRIYLQSPGWTQEEDSVLKDPVTGSQSQPSAVPLAAGMQMHLCGSQMLMLQGFLLARGEREQAPGKPGPASTSCMQGWVTG